MKIFKILFNFALCVSVMDIIVLTGLSLLHHWLIILLVSNLPLCFCVLAIRNSLYFKPKLPDRGSLLEKKIFDRYH